MSYTSKVCMSSFIIVNYLELKLKSLWCPPRSSQCSHRICNNRSHGSTIQMLDRHTNGMAMLKVWILDSLPFQKTHHYATHNTALSVNVSFRLISWSKSPNVTIWEGHTFADHLNVISDHSLVSNNNMADMRICVVVVVTQQPNFRGIKRCLWALE